MKRLLLVLAVGLFLVPATADAFYRSDKHGTIDLSGRIRSTNTIRHLNMNTHDFIMQRNELKLRFEWKWLDRGKVFKRHPVPWLKRSDIFMLYRGIYDSVYDFTPGLSERYDFQGDEVCGSHATLTSRECMNLESISDDERDALKFKNRIREAYIDLYFKHIPLTLRIGKQQVTWGESDGFRLNDRANTLDLSWHFFQELPPPGYGFDEIRQPFFMIKGLWDLHHLGPLSQPFIEFYWNPGDWNPGKISFAPRPWGIKLLDPIKNSAGTGALQSAALCGEAPIDPVTGKNTCTGLLNGTELFKHGNYSRNPLENSQFGLRFHFITPKGFEWTLNYLYQRFAPDGSPVAMVKGIPAGSMVEVADTSFAPGLQPGSITAELYCNNLPNSDDVHGPTGNLVYPWATGEACIEYFSPYVHTIGFSLNFFEPTYTQTVWRIESVIDFDLPFFNGDKNNANLSRVPDGPVLLPGISHRNMWKGLLAFDRPTWIRSLNKKTTFFITGQLFWHYIINHERRRCYKDNITDPTDPDYVGLIDDWTENCGNDTEFLIDADGDGVPEEQTGLIGPFDLPKLSSLTNKGRDTVRQWEVISTLAILGFYRGGSLVPAFIYIIDPVNSYAQEVALAVDYFYTPNLALNFTTRLIWSGYPWDPNGNIHKKGKVGPYRLDGRSYRDEQFSPWTLNNINRGRSESGFMISYQF